MVQLDNARSQSSDMRHKSIGETLQRIMNEQAQMRGDIRSHTEEDDKVANRVTILEESQKRVTWVAIVAIPSAIAGWEGLKKFLAFH